MSLDEERTFKERVRKKESQEKKFTKRGGRP